MAVEIGEIDRFDDRQVADYWAVSDAANRHKRPYGVFFSLRACTVALRGNDPTWVILPYVARLDGAVVGASQLVMPQLDNTHLLFTHPLVHPDARRQGVGSALLDTVIEVARAHRRDTIVIDASRPVGAESSPGWDFLAHRGFTPGQRDVHRVLDLPVDESRLDEWANAGASHHSAYTLVQIADAIPDELVSGYCALQEAFNAEAPLGELDLEPEVWTTERLRANEERRALQGTWSETTLAIAPDGSVAGITELSVTDEGAGNCTQGATLVLRGHRGHRLGMALKVANLRAMQRRVPQIRLIHSWNAEENAHMAAINLELGFRPVEEVADMQRKL